MLTESSIRPLCENGCGQRIARQRARYCSQRCGIAHDRRSLVALWESGNLPPRLFFNRTIRRHIIALADERCQRCGWSERNLHTGRVPLEIEHIDGDWTNNRTENLVVLCPNCHALTATYRGANRGHGRPGRPGAASKNESSRLEPMTRSSIIGPPTFRTATS